MEFLAGVDLGGTNLVVGLVTPTGKLVSKRSVRTRPHRGVKAVRDDIVRLIRQELAAHFIGENEPGAIGIGSPGIVKDGVVLYASNLDFRNVPLASLVEEKINSSVHVVNDGNAAALGESLAGAGKGYSSLVALTIGTGIGSGIILDSKIYEGFNGVAGEAGHMTIVAGGRTCSCGKKGCLEAYCSATSLRELTREAMEQDKNSLLWKLTRGNGDKVSARTAFQAMKQGDIAGTKVVEDFLFHLSIGVSNVISLLQPEVLCLGGGVAREGDTILIPLQKQVAEQSFLTNEQHRTKLLTATLGSDAGLIGAALAADAVRAENL